MELVPRGERLLDLAESFSLWALKNGKKLNSIEELATEVRKAGGFKHYNTAGQLVTVKKLSNGTFEIVDESGKVIKRLDNFPSVANELGIKIGRGKSGAGTGKTPKSNSEITSLLKDSNAKKVQEILKTQSKTSAGPCLSGIYDPATDKIFFGQNFKTNSTGKDAYYKWLENDADPLIRDLVKKYDVKIQSGEIKLSEVADFRLAGHSELVALDEALKARRKQGIPVNNSTISEFYLQNINLTEAYKSGEIVTKIRCEHCRFLTDGINLIGHD